MKRNMKIMLNVLTAVCLSMTFKIQDVHGATVDECAEVARSYGVSETAIQSAYNAYYADPESYTPEKLDNVIRTLNLYGSDSDAVIKEYFGITDDGNSNSDTSQETSAPTTDEPAIDTSESDSTDSKNDDYVSPIDSSDFINMTISEKVDFVNSLPEEDKSEFINNLSTEERNSIIKQLPIEDKTELLSTFIDATSEMGLNMTIDEITDDSVSLSVRNNDGTLIEQSSLGVIVEDTGYDYRLLFAGAGTGVLLSSIGIYLIFRKYSKENNKK